MIRAGDLDRRVSLQRSTDEVDPIYGEAHPVWSTFATVAASVRQVSGREFLAATEQAGERRAVFIIRWRGDVLTTDRVAYLGEHWDVDDLREIGRREGLEIHARAIG